MILLVIWLFILSLIVANLLDREHDRAQSECVDLSKLPKDMQVEYWFWRNAAEHAEWRLRQTEKDAK